MDDFPAIIIFEHRMEGDNSWQWQENKKEHDNNESDTSTILIQW